MEQQLKDFIGNVDECIALFKQKVERIEKERAALQAKCDKYEKALKEIAKTALVVGQPSFMWQANEALSSEGKEVDNDR